MRPCRVLIVDDSSLSREVLRRVLERDPRLQVVGEARTGEEAVAQVRALQPHLVTMDLNMPGMGGLKAIEVLMRERPTPIVVISERSSTSGVDLNAEALSRGALELVPKSAMFGAGDAERGAFVARLRALAEAGLAHGERPAPTGPVSTEPPRLLGIGASTGGPRALALVLSSLPRGFPLPIVVVQHMADDFFHSFLRFLRDASGHPVVHVQPGTRLEPGAVYVAPPRQELFVRDNLGVELLPPPPPRDLLADRRQPLLLDGDGAEGPRPGGAADGDGRRRRPGAPAPAPHGRAHHRAGPRHLGRLRHAARRARAGRRRARAAAARHRALPRARRRGRGRGPAAAAPLARSFPA